MLDPMAQLSASDRRRVADLAAKAGVEPDAMISEIVSAWLRLWKDVPNALPEDPMRGLVLGAARRAGR